MVLLWCTQVEHMLYQAAVRLDWALNSGKLSASTPHCLSPFPKLFQSAAASGVVVVWRASTSSMFMWSIHCHLSVLDVEIPMCLCDEDWAGSHWEVHFFGLVEILNGKDGCLAGWLADCGTCWIRKGPYGLHLNFRSLGSAFKTTGVQFWTTHPILIFSAITNTYINITLWKPAVKALKWLRTRAPKLCAIACFGSAWRLLVNFTPILW